MVKQNVYKRRTKEETRHPEVLGMNVVHKAELLSPGPYFNDVAKITLKGRSVDQLAQDVSHDSNVIGIRTFRRVEETVLVNGKAVYVSSRDLDSSTTYIDGQIMTADDIRENVADPGELICNMERMGWDRVIKTRAGHINASRKAIEIYCCPSGKKVKTGPYIFDNVCITDR